MEKKGLSQVITTLILILLGLVAIGIVWVVIVNVISKSSDEVDLGKFTVQMKIKDVVLGDNQVNVTVERESGTGELNSIKFIISDGKNSQTFEKPTSIKELEKQTFTLDYSGYVGKISIAGVVGGSTGNELDSKETTWTYFDDMDDVSDWLPAQSAGGAGTDMNYTSNNGILNMSTIFDDPAPYPTGNEYTVIRKDVTDFQPIGNKRYLEIRYKINQDLVDAGYAQLWAVSSDCLASLYYPRYTLQNSSTDWITEVIDLQQIFTQYPDCGNQYTGQQIEYIGLNIDDWNLSGSGERPKLDVDYIKLGQSF